MIVKQLDPVLYLETPLGKAAAHFLLVDGGESWKFITFQDDTGECFGWENHKVRLQPNITEGRFFVTPIHLSDAEKKALAPHIARRLEHLAALKQG